MLKKIIIVCTAMVVDAFCLNTPEAEITYQVINGALSIAPERFQKGYDLKKQQDADSKIDLGVFSLCYKGYERLPNQSSFIREYLESVLKSLSKLPRGITTCIVVVIDDNKSEVMLAINDIIRTCNQFNKQNIPVYINWNGSNLGIQGARDNLLKLVRLFRTEYIFLADSDDILHQDCISIMYQAMKSDENLHLLLGEYTILGYLDNRSEDIKPYQMKSLNNSNFDVVTFCKDSADEGNNDWAPLLEDKPLVVKKCRKTADFGNGYLPAMIRYFDQIPTDCCESDGNMLFWYGSVVSSSESIKPDSNNAKKDPSYAILTPVDDESFLYFYRLHTDSHGHHVDQKASNFEVLSYFIEFIYFFKSRNFSTEQMIGMLIKELCPRQHIIDTGANIFNFNDFLNSLPQEQHAALQACGALINGGSVRAFWKMIKDLSNGDITTAKNWDDQYRKMDLTALNVSLDSLGELARFLNGECRKIEANNNSSHSENSSS